MSEVLGDGAWARGVYAETMAAREKQQQRSQAPITHTTEADAGHGVLLPAWKVVGAGTPHARHETVEIRIGTTNASATPEAGPQSSTAMPAIEKPDTLGDGAWSRAVPREPSKPPQLVRQPGDPLDWDPPRSRGDDYHRAEDWGSPTRTLES